VPASGDDALFGAGCALTTGGTATARVRCGIVGVVVLLLVLLFFFLKLAALFRLAIKVELVAEELEHALDGARLALDNVVDVGLGKAHLQVLLKHLGAEGVPVVLLGGGAVSGYIVMKVNDFRLEVVHDFCCEDTVAEVAIDLPLRSGERN